MSGEGRDVGGSRLSRRHFTRVLLAGVGVAMPAVLTGCFSPREFARARGGKARLSIATGGTSGVYYPYGGGVAKIISETIPNTEATAEATSGSVDNMKFIGGGKSDIAFTLADTLKDAYEGSGTFEKFGKVPAYALAVLYTNFTQVVTLADKGIDRIADLRGKVVSTGAPGSGTETIAFRCLEAAGLNYRTDVSRQGLGVGPSVDALKDGKIEAFFWSGGVPTGAVLDLANTPGMTMKMLPNDDILPVLQQQYSPELYYAAPIPKAAYTGMAEDVNVIGVANVLVVDERMSDELAHDITRVLFDKQAELIAIHSEAKNLKLETATTGSPIPFHPGAIQFYREKGSWNG